MLEKDLIMKWVWFVIMVVAYPISIALYVLFVVGLSFMIAIPLSTIALYGYFFIQSVLNLIF